MIIPLTESEMESMERVIKKENAGMCTICTSDMKSEQLLISTIYIFVLHFLNLYLGFIIKPKIK